MSSEAGTDTLESLSSVAKSTTKALNEVKEVLGSLKERYGDYFTKEKAKEVAHEGYVYAKQHPLPTVLVAAGVGLLIGYLIKNTLWESDERREWSVQD